MATQSGDTSQLHASLLQLAPCISLQNFCLKFQDQIQVVFLYFKIMQDYFNKIMQDYFNTISFPVTIVAYSLL